MVCSLGLGVVSAFSAPASQALIADLLPRSQLQSAVALNSMTYNLARAIGPGLAALSVRKLGVPASFAINSGLSPAQPRSTSYTALTVPLRSRRSVPGMELHFIADDLEEHAWYVDLVADFVEGVELYLAQLEEAR
jgi:MFS family permease